MKNKWEEETGERIISKNEVKERREQRKSVRDRNGKKVKDQ